MNKRKASERRKFRSKLLYNGLETAQDVFQTLSFYPDPFIIYYIINALKLVQEKLAQIRGGKTISEVQSLALAPAPRALSDDHGRLLTQINRNTWGKEGVLLHYLMPAVKDIAAKVKKT